MTIEDIKTELREIIELSSKITSAGKFCEGWPEETAIISKVCNLTPKMAKALLTAIQMLEGMAQPLNCECSDEALRAYEQDSAIAKEALETIRHEWEVQA
jgi:hypothetical protein